jgi:tyrosyl-tRNA synthetase
VSAQFFERLRERAVQIHIAEHLRARLERGDKLRVKLGLDPTAPDLHVGHLVLFDVLRMFQDEGHTVVVIIGDYTAQIGDPSGRSETRPVLTAEQVAANAETYFEQVDLVLYRKQIEVRHNSEWLAPMTAADILRLLGKATLQQVLQREDFAERIKAGAPIGAHEVLYPFNQAYDSVAVEADLELGGTDQLFNLLFGREIQKAYGQKPQDIAVFPLLEGTDGVQKMSKSLGNYIGINEAPEDIYGKTMSIPDQLTEKYVRLISGLHQELQDQVLAMKPRDAKAALAHQLVARLHGPEAAADAEADFEARFRRHESPSQVRSEIFKAPPSAYEAILQAGLAKSGNEIRRLVAQQGVKVNGGSIQNAMEQLHDGDLVQVGKRHSFRIQVVG